MKNTLLILALAVGLNIPSLHSAESGSEPALTYVEFSRMGNPADVLEVKTEMPRPLAEGEVRVRVLATPIHPSNLLQISGNYGVDPALPSTPGSEGIGRVIESSAAVTHLAVGQLVMLAGGGTWRQEMVGSAADFVPLPDLGPVTSDVIEQLSMATVNPLTALLMLTTFVDLSEGDWIVHSAANSAVGGYIIQLAKQRGIKTINIVRREGLAEALKSKGADVVLIDGADLPERIAEATNDAPVSLAIDAVGGQTFGRLARSLTEGSTIVSYGALSGQPVTVSPALTIFSDIRIRGFWLSKWFQTASMAEKQAAFGQVIPLIASGALKADIDSRFSVSEIKQAVTRAAERGRSGKVLIVPNAD